MRRRALLATLAAGTTALAGCPGRSGQRETVTPADVPSTTDTGTATDSPTNAATETETPFQPEPPEPDASAAVAEFDTLPQTYAFVPATTTTDEGVRSALWFATTATANQPALVRGWLRNRHDEPQTVDVRDLAAVGRTTATFSGAADQSATATQSTTAVTDPTLRLVPTEANDIATSVPEPRRTDDGRWVVDADGPWMAESVNLDVAEWVELEYALVGAAGTDRPTGTYEFPGDTPRSIVAWSTPRPGPETTSRFADRSMPSVRGADVEWFHEADETATLYVHPSTERAELDATVAFETVNHTHRSVACGPWGLRKLVDGRWHLANPFVEVPECPDLAPGERRRFALHGHNRAADACAGDCGLRDLNRGYLGGGTYGVVQFAAGEPILGAMFELIGDPVTVKPTGDATVERDGENVVVTRPRYGDSATPADDTFSLRRADSAEHRLLPERLMAPDIDDAGASLRDGIAAFDDGVDRVIVRADELVVDDVFGEEIERTESVVGDQAYVASRTVTRT